MKSVASIQGTDSHQIQMVAILKAIEEPYDPFCTAGVTNKSGCLQNVPLGSDMAFLTLSQHVCLTQL